MKIFQKINVIILQINQIKFFKKIIVKIYRTKNLPSLTIERHLLFHFEEVHNQRELSFHDY